MSQIARVWFGKLPASRVEEYVEYVKSTGVRELRATEGNLGVLVLTRLEGETAEISVISFWDSLAAIEKFAGKDINKARYYPEDHKFLHSLDPELHHYEVAGSFGIPEAPEIRR